MKILKNNIEGFISKIKTHNLKGVLLYGSETSIVFSREADIKKQFADFEHIKLDLDGEKDLKDVLNEIYTASFFGSKKFLQITGLESKFGNFEEILKGLEQFEGFILLNLPYNLDGKSKIRKLCEASVIVGVIACYADEEVDTISIINNFLQHKKIQIEQDALKFVVQNFGNNRSILLQELEKLSLFKLEGKITLKEAMFIMNEEVSGNTFEAINHFFAKDLKLFLKEAEGLKEAMPASVLLSSLINYNFKLLEILEEKEQSKKTIDTLLTEKFIFFKQVPKMKNHLSKWDIKMLNLLARIFLKLEIEIRKSGELGYETLIINLLHSNFVLE
jgi:DNA polymerase III delta subunit